MLTADSALVLLHAASSQGLSTPDATSARGEYRLSIPAVVGQPAGGERLTACGLAGPCARRDGGGGVRTPREWIARARLVSPPRALDQLPRWIAAEARGLMHD